MTWTKYKFVILLSIAAVTVGSAYTLANFNEIVTPDVPVQAIHFENVELGAYRLEILGEYLVIKIPGEYYALIDYKCGETLTFIYNNTAEFRKKFLLDFISRDLQIKKN